MKRRTSLQSTLGVAAAVAIARRAFPQRDVFGNMLCRVGRRHGDDPGAHIQWARQYWTGPESFTHGFYVNDREVDHSAAVIRDNYRHNHDRLVAVKNRYDPKNLFRLNADVQPTV